MTMTILDMHSHWGTERHYPLRGKAQQAKQFDIWRTECRFWEKPAMAQYFRDSGIRVMLDLGYTREVPLDDLRSIHDEMIEFQRENADVVLGNWVQIAADAGEAGVAELDRVRAAGAGLTGLAASAIGNRRPISDPSFNVFYDYCTGHRVPVMFFVGYTGIGSGFPGGNGLELEWSHPRYVDQVAARWPKLSIIAARSAWPWESEMIATLLHKGNVYTEFHGMSPKRLGDEMKREIRGRLKHKIMYGNDFPMLHYDKIIGDWRAEGYADDILERIFHGNAEAFLERLAQG
jgi:predicted TIM-barrel fold metal-dependent hydrolase